MFGKLLRVACVVVPLAGCARPKYENQRETGGVNQEFGQMRASNCPVRFKTSGLCLSWQWEEKPTDSKAGSLVFKVFRGSAYDDTPVLVDLPSNPALVLWMPSMGHGSSPTTVNRLDLGTYRASSVFFVMPGEWEMRFQVKDGANVQDEAVVGITI